MLNRSAVIVRPKKPFCDWLRAVDDDDAPEVTLDSPRSLTLSAASDQTLFESLASFDYKL